MNVFDFKGQDIIALDKQSLDQIKQAAKESPLRRARYCLHHELTDPIHEMVIAFCQNSYVRPHRHANKTESFHVIEGELLVVFFDDHGQVTETLKMSSFERDSHSFIYRLSSNRWHMVIPLTESVVIHEVTRGPFVRDEQRFPDWAPEDNDKEGIEAFVNNIIQSVG